MSQESPNISGHTGQQVPATLSSNPYGYARQSTDQHYYQPSNNQLLMNNMSNVSGSHVGLPIQCNLTHSSATQQSPQTHTCHPQAMTMTTTTTCLQHQPIYNQLYQSLQTPQHPSAFQATLFAPPNREHSMKMNSALRQQHLFVNTIRPTMNDVTRQSMINLNSNFLQQQVQFHPQLQPVQNSMIATISHPQNDKPSSVIAQFNNSPSSSSTIDVNADKHQWRRTNIVNTIGQISPKLTTATTNQRRKLVESSSGSSSTSESSRKASSSSSSNVESGRFKSYLTHLVLASNIPFAYAIILVAFLITVIAATSIITILTIILTITGYTAYPITENTFNTSLIIGVVCASFALALVTASLVVWRRHCQAAYYYLDDPQTASRGTNSPQLSETYDDTEYGSIPVSEWDKHVKKLHIDGDIGFSREFEQIQNSNSPNLTYEHSQMAENKHKNRYINIVAYDHTRVTLRQLPGQKKPGSDYINANFIDGYNKPRAYIGTQGPLVSTFDDYWRMIWEQRVVIIVMITNLQERGRRKCDMYWPKEGTETYGHIQVKLLQEVVMATYTLRTFTAKNLKMKRKPGGERTVYQYHYTNWPDHGVPDHPLPVLSFVRKSASANPPGAGAIICHCSAGCGRSGTYIVIDAMLKQIRQRQSIDVVDFLKHIRNQRNYLVQTEEQYIFIHDALVEAIESGETEIASHFIAKYIQLLQTGGNAQVSISQKNSSYSITNGLQSPIGQQQHQQAAISINGSDNQQLIANSQSNLLLAANGNSLTINGSNNKNSNTTSRTQSAAGQWSLLERQYRLVASFKAKDFNVASALKPFNHKSKNRNINFLPLEGHRVHITPKPGIEGSDYINATFLMGFNHLREFIVTQHPLNQTFSDFWQMVYDHNSQTIVLLSPMNDLKEFPQFWPQKEDEVDYGSFKVKLTNESTLVKPENGGVIITRDFIMRSNQDDYELQTRVIHCPGWPECCGPLSSVFDLIQVVQNATQQQASQQKLHDGHTTTTTVTIGQEHEPQNGGPIIVVDKFGGTEAATFAVLTTLFKQINFEDAVDVYMYAKLAHLRRPGIWTSQDDYLFLYRAIENYASTMHESVSNAAGGGTNDKLNSQANLSNMNFHQTMTLDRHKHKSQSNSHNTSTMRRRQNPPVSNELSKSNNQLLIDHNHNHISGPILQQQEVNANSLHLKSIQNNINNSPYNSAVSIGTSPHQHLLANNNRKVSSNQLQQQATDHYLYSMS